MKLLLDYISSLNEDLQKDVVELIIHFIVKKEDLFNMILSHENMRYVRDAFLSLFNYGGGKY